MHVSVRHKMRHGTDISVQVVEILDIEYLFTSVSFGHEYIVTSDLVLSSVPTARVDLVSGI